MRSLPIELLVHIFSYLPGEDVVRFEQLSSKFKQIINQNRVYIRKPRISFAIDKYQIFNFESKVCFTFFLKIETELFLEYGCSNGNNERIFLLSYFMCWGDYIQTKSSSTIRGKRKGIWKGAEEQISRTFQRKWYFEHKYWEIENFRNTRKSKTFLQMALRKSGCGINWFSKNYSVPLSISPLSTRCGSNLDF